MESRSPRIAPLQMVSIPGSEMCGFGQVVSIQIGGSLAQMVVSAVFARMNWLEWCRGGNSRVFVPNGMLVVYSRNSMDSIESKSIRVLLPAFADGFVSGESAESCRGSKCRKRRPGQHSGQQALDELDELAQIFADTRDRREIHCPSGKALDVYAVASCATSHSHFSRASHLRPIAPMHRLFSSNFCDLACDSSLSLCNMNEHSPQTEAGLRIIAPEFLAVTH